MPSCGNLLPSVRAIYCRRQAQKDMWCRSFDIRVACFPYRGSADFVEPQFAFSIAHYTKCRLKCCVIGGYSVCSVPPDTTRTLHSHYTFCLSPIFSICSFSPFFIFPEICRRVVWCSVRVVSRTTLHSYNYLLYSYLCDFSVV